MSIYATGISSLVFFPILIYSFVEGKQRLVFVSDQDRSFAVLCCSSIWVLHIQVAGENVGCWCFWRTGSRLGWEGGGYRVTRWLMQGRDAKKMGDVVVGEIAV